MNISRRIWPLILFFAVMQVHGATADTPVVQAPKDAKQAEVTISLAGDVASVKIGDALSRTLMVAYKRVPARSYVYLLVSPLFDDSLVTTTGDHLSGKEVSLDLSLSATLAESDGGPFRIGDSNHPEELTVGPGQLEEMLVRLVGPRKARTLASAFGESGLRLVFAYLAFLGDGGDGHEQATLSLILPSLEHEYDAILITPVLLSTESDGRTGIVYNSDRMKSIRVRFNRGTS